MKISILGKGGGLILFTLIAIASFPLNASAHAGLSIAAFQQLTITGTVADATGPLPGVTVLVKGSTTTTVTDDNGRFTIVANTGDTLVFEYLGYKSLEVNISGNDVGNITLSEDATSLEEVTINAGYYTVAQREATGSISKITAKDIEKQPVNNPLSALSGRMAGVSITESSGLPGAPVNLQVRGRASLRADANMPLYIVDGVPYSAQSMGSTDISGGILPGNISPLSAINPSDIASIEVLKDADATAIYGSRGSNGVVLITTKKGSAGKTFYSVNAFTSMGKAANLMKIMNTEQYLAMRREAFANDGISEYGASDYDINGTWDQDRYTDWQKELLGATARISSLQAAISGGSQSTQFLVSGTARSETTVFPGQAKYTKAALHSNLSHQNQDGRFKMGMTVDYLSDNNRLPGIDLTGEANTIAPNAPALFDSQGNLNWEQGTFNNPLAYLEAHYKTLTNTLIGNANLSYTIAPHWSAKANLGYTEAQVAESRTAPSSMYNPSWGLGSESSALYLNNSRRLSWIAEPQINWDYETGNWRFSALAGFTFQELKNSQLSQYGSGFATNSLINSMAAASYLLVLSDNETNYKYTAGFTRLNVGYSGKYFLNLTARRDGSSRFGPERRFANFGAVGTSWLLSEEDMLKEVTAIDLLKIRASYGTTGNDQIGDYQYLNTYSLSGNLYNGLTGLIPSRLYNPNFGWETNKKAEAAMEIGLFNHLYASAAYYRNRSSNQLVGIPLPATTGFSSVPANLNAEVENTGWEFQLAANDLSYGRFKWNASANLTIPHNRLVAFPGLEGSTYANTYALGESLYIQKMYHYTGIDPDTGVYTFEDYNQDGRITAADRQYVADLSPKYLAGVTNDLTYGNWQLNFHFQYVKQLGRNYISGTTYPGAMQNMPVEVINHWPTYGDTAAHQIYTSGANGQAVSATSRFRNSNAAVSNASFLRLKTVSLSYSIPKDWIKDVNCSLYLQAQNLFTLTPYKGADPEIQSNYYLPSLRQVSFGTEINF